MAGHRFDIYEEIGCYPAIYNVWLAYPLVLCWPIAIGLVSAVYCCKSLVLILLHKTNLNLGLTLRAFWKRRPEFQILLAANSSMNIYRYFRLMALAMTEVLCTIPISSFFVYNNAYGNQINTYRGWSDLHYHWSFVGQYPSVLWRSDSRSIAGLEMTRWLAVACAMVFFFFFGFAEEARRHYRVLFTALCKSIGIQPRQKVVPLTNLHIAMPPIPPRAHLRDSLFSVFSDEGNQQEENLKSNDISLSILDCSDLSTPDFQADDHSFYIV